MTVIYHSQNRRPDEEGIKTQEHVVVRRLSVVRTVDLMKKGLRPWVAASWGRGIQSEP